MKKIVFLFTLYLYTFTPLYLYCIDLGFAKGDGGRPGAFLQYGAGARSLGMGKTFVGIADDASAVYWNPAGLAQLQQKELVALQNKLYVDTDYSFLAFATPLKSRCKGVEVQQEEQRGVKVYRGTMGIALVNLHSTGFQLRDEYNYELGEGAVNESAALVSFGQQLTMNKYQIAVGATAKIVNQNVDTKKDTGYGMDIGLLSNYKKLNFGLALQNIIAPRILLKNKEDIYPLSATLGIGYRLLQDKLLLAMDINKTENRSVKFHIGSEYGIARMFAIRAGIDETEAAIGAGIRWRNYAIDYAFAYHDAWKGYEDLGASHRFGLTVKWGEKAGVKVYRSKGVERENEKEQMMKLAAVTQETMVDASNSDKAVEVQQEETASGKVVEQTKDYTVKPGDCLWTIAAKPEIYGNHWNWKLIYEANKNQIKNPDLIYPEQILHIPR